MAVSSIFKQGLPEKNEQGLIDPDQQITQGLRGRLKFSGQGPAKKFQAGSAQKHFRQGLVAKS